MPSCGTVGGLHRFEGTCCIHLRDERPKRWYVSYYTPWHPGRL